MEERPRSSSRQERRFAAAQVSWEPRRLGGTSVVSAPTHLRIPSRRLRLSAVAARETTPQCFENTIRSVRIVIIRDAWGSLAALSSWFLGLYEISILTLRQKSKYFATCRLPVQTIACTAASRSVMILPRIDVVYMLKLPDLFTKFLQFVNSLLKHRLLAFFTKIFNHVSRTY